MGIGGGGFHSFGMATANDRKEKRLHIVFIPIFYIFQPLV